MEKTIEKIKIKKIPDIKIKWKIDFGGWPQGFWANYCLIRIHLEGLMLRSITLQNEKENAYVTTQIINNNKSKMKNFILNKFYQSTSS